MKGALTNLVTIAFFCGSFSVLAQEITVTTLTELDSTVYETSGLIYLDGRIITHNDGTNLPILYEIDSISHIINRQVVIADYSNNDWEDICFDSTFIYIADFGNNHNNRTNLRVLRVSIYDYFNTLNDTVIADVISFSYSDQLDFSSSLNQTNFDAETLISYEDSLYIFTKNWNNERTNIYSLSKQPGSYLISSIDSFNSGGLITGGDHNKSTDEIILIGYSMPIPIPFVIKLHQYSAGKFSNGVIDKKLIKTDGSPQIEGIAVIDQNNYLLSAEASFFGDQKLYKLTYENPNSVFNMTENKHTLEKIVDVLGRETKGKTNQLLIYIYDDGTVEKRIIN